MTDCAVPYFSQTSSCLVMFVDVLVLLYLGTELVSSKCMFSDKF